MIALATLEFGIALACLWIFHKSNDAWQNYMFLLFAMTSAAYGAMIASGKTLTEMNEMFWIEHIVIWIVVVAKTIMILRKEGRLAHHVK